MRPLQASPGELERRRSWVEARHHRRFMNNLSGTLWYGPAVLPLCAALMWSTADRFSLVAWLVIGALLSLVRMVVLRHFIEVIDKQLDADVLRFAERYRWFWCLVPLHWGFSTFLFYGVASPTVEFSMLAVLVGVASVATNAYASDIRGTLWYLRSVLIGPLLDWILSITGLLGQGHTQLQHFVLASFALMYYLACANSARKNHAFQTEMLGLQFDNERLIESLDQQTRETQDAMASRSRLLAGAAHDLRQPVHALSLFADWLSEEPELVHQLSPKIVQSTRAVNRLFDGMFDLAKLDQDPPIERCSVLDLRSELEAVAAQYEPIARERGLLIRMRCKSNVGVCVGRETLRRVLGNLLDNAIKYTEQGGVLIAARQRSGRWVIEVWDTGLGIEATELEAIFKEFYRVKRHEGTQDSFGLGLSIVSRLTTRLNAKIAVSSTLNRGSRFSLSLPTMAEQLVLQPMPEEPPCCT